MAIRRVAVIYDDRARPDTTGGYCRRALESLVEVVHFRPDELAAVPASGFDLYLNIDDGFSYPLPDALRPSAWWAIDTHLNFARCRERATGFDFVFAAQRDGAARIEAERIAKATWLPLALDPEIHGKQSVAKQFDVAFVGNVFPGVRAELLDLIRRRYPKSWIGQCYFHEMAKTYSAARTVFNRSIENDVNMRVFEGLASGSLLVTNDLSQNGLAELFQDGVHLATYRGPEELLDKLAFYLGREAVRERIAAAGHAEALANHTYRHRMERLLGEVEATLKTFSANGRPAGVAAESAPKNGQVSGQTELRDSTYFGHARPEVLALVPTGARRVLDVGCGAGRLGEAIKGRQQAEVIGIELNESAAAWARQRLDRVVVGNVEQLDVEFGAGSLDAIVCADILEHLREPERLLLKARTWLAADGSLIASIPNVRHHSVVRSLLQGNWTYESAGLLDRDHVRFFTRREIEKMFFRAGFAIDELRWVGVPGEDRSGQRPGEVKIGRLQVAGLSEADADEFHAYQYLVRARPRDLPDAGLTSIVIPTFNQLEYTRQCLDSIRRLTDEPYEIIVVDNASTDGTVEYLRGLVDVKLIENRWNRGFPAAVNQGIHAASGRQVLLLNNDVVVTTGWLTRLLRPLFEDAQIGLVGPSSNCVSGPQEVEVNYDELTELDGFAWDWGKLHDGRREEIGRLVGFCLLIRRSVIDQIGMLDEQFGIGCFEDDDYTLRAVRAGYRAVIARDAFVHHYGSRTFVASGVDTAGLLRRNHQLFTEKWANTGGIVEAPASVPAEHIVGQRTLGKFAVEIAPGGGLRLRCDREGPKVSLCMIVRDSARTLPACLESIRPWVDEMVIVDTGSVDNTPRIVEAYGAKLFHFPWCDDFSAARNESLRHAQGEWLFWMDSDDTIPADCGRRIRGLIDQAVPPNVLGFVVQVHCPGGGQDGEAASDITAVDHVKLFRNRPDLRFDGRIHEQILPAIRAAGGAVAWTDLYVVHSGSDQGRSAQTRKLERDMRILKRELAERPEHPFTLFNLGMTCSHASRYDEAVDYLRRGIARSNPAESHLRKAYALLVYALMRLGRREEALDTCNRSRALFPHDVELQFRQGVLLHDLGRLPEARSAYLGVVENHEDRHFASIDKGLTGFKLRQNLAVLATDMGNLDEAEAHWRHVVQEAPSYRSGWRGLGDNLIRRRRFAEAKGLTDEMLADPRLRIEGLLLRSRLAIQRGRIHDARIELDRAVSESADDLETIRSRCQFLFEHGSADEAERALRTLMAHEPEDGSAYHNLGTLMMKSNRHSEAVDAYQKSIRHRPNYPATYLNLAYALNDSGHAGEARAAVETAARLAPNDLTVRDALKTFRGSRSMPVPAKAEAVEREHAFL